MGLVIDKPLRVPREAGPELSSEPEPPKPAAQPLSLGPGDPVASGRYRILETIARKRDTVIYAAQQVAVGRRVALKMRVGEGARRAASAEARVLAEVCVQNLIQIWDGDATDGGSWLALEHGGEAIAAYIDKRRIPLSIAVRVVADALFGLDALHQAGFVHRTICPEHVLINTADIHDEQGTQWVKVAGLGWACTPGTALVDSEVAQRLSITHGVYLAPELMSGETIDLRADLYSAGLLLRCLAEGTPNPTREEVDLPRELRRWLERATALRPEERYPNAQVMRQELLAVPLKVAAEPGSRSGEELPVAVHARKARTQDTQPLGGLSDRTGLSSISMNTIQSPSPMSMGGLAQQHSLAMRMGASGLNELDRDGTPTRFMLVPARSQPSTALAPREMAAMAGHLSTRQVRRAFAASTQRVRRTEDGGQGLMVVTGVVCLATIYWATNLDERGMDEVCAILDCGGVGTWGREALTSVRDHAWQLSQQAADATAKVLEFVVERLGQFLNP